MIKLTKLSAALKDLNFVAWIKKDNYNYILSECFILKTSQDIKGGALTKLISLLETVPQEGQGILNRYNHRKEMTEAEMENLLNLLECKDKRPVHFTNLIYQTDKKLFSIFKGEDYIFVDKKYLDLIDLCEKNIEIFGTNRVSPVYFNNGVEELMILPVRLEENPFYLKGNNHD